MPKLGSQTMPIAVVHYPGLTTNKSGEGSTEVGLERVRGSGGGGVAGQAAGYRLTARLVCRFGANLHINRAG